MKYKPGDKVVIVDKWGPDCLQNYEGKMDHWLGQVMTIKTDKGYYRMVEDAEENDGNGWFWNNSCIAGYADEIYDDIELEVLRLL